MPSFIDDPNMALEPNDLGLALDDQPAQVQLEPFVVLDQAIDLDFNFRGKAIRGKTTIKIWLASDQEPEFIRLDARQCEIDTANVTVNGKTVHATYNDPVKLMDTPAGYDWEAGQHFLRTQRTKSLTPTRKNELSLTGRERKGCMPADGSLKVWLRPAPDGSDSAAAASRTIGGAGGIPKIKLKKPSLILKPTPQEESGAFTIEIPFKTTNARDGYHFVGVTPGDTRYPHLYTRHSLEPGMVGCVFPCIDDRTRVNEWNITLKFPRTVGDAMHELPDKSSKYEAETWTPSLSDSDKALDMTAICSGTLIGERIDANDSTKKIMQFQASSCGPQHVGFSIGPFEIVDLYSQFRTEEDDEVLKDSAVKIYGYCLPRRADEVRNTAAAMAMAADYFVLTFAKYPFDNYKLCFVDDMVESTVPLQAFSLCSSRLLFPEDIIDTEIEVSRTLIHTLACQYFGVYMNPDQRSDTWIVVGLAYYMTDLFMRRLCGNNFYRFQIRMAANELVKQDVGRPSIQDLGEYLVYGDFEMEFMVRKAPLVIFILDRRLLKASNTAGVTRVVSGLLRDASTALDTTLPGPYVMSSDRFRRLCEKRGRIRLESFWAQWVVGAGIPQLDLNQRFNKKKLEVEITVNQEQHTKAQEAHTLVKEHFWRDLMEERHAIYASEVPTTFTGPMTFRVHEADGTPYEHCLEIKADALQTKGSRLNLPYNTKYKRIKKVRQRKKEKEQQKVAAQGRGETERKDDEERDDEEGVDINMLGDVLLSQEDMDSWRLVDWDENMQQQMDQESYEWIRVDCDSEWIYQIKTNLLIYMTVSQLQQDRDIAAQVESMLKLTHNPPSNIQTTVLLRTLYDSKYYPGIRQMAANVLTNHAHPTNNWRGMRHLMRVFQTFYCYPNSTTPRPNDFHDKKEYMVQSTIPLAIAQVRGGQDDCPLEAREFILQQLVYNSNSKDNPYSDHMYVAKLLEALAASLIRTQVKGQERYEENAERVEFRERALEQIERYRRMDEWASSYQNIWTVTALDCKQKLMSSGVIPVSGLDFVQYLNEDTIDVVQVKAFECLVDLQLFLRPSILKFFFCFLRSHHSPFVRDRLFKALCRGLAAIALGEHQLKAEEPTVDQMDEEGDFLLEKADDVLARRQKELARKEDIRLAAVALQEDLHDNELLQKEMWKALDSPTLGIAERRNLLELCSVVFKEVYSLPITLKYPLKWEARRGAYIKGKKLEIIFTSSYRTQMRSTYRDTFGKDGVPVPQAMTAPKAPERKKLIISGARLSLSAPANAAQEALTRKGSIAIPATTSPLAMSPAAIAQSGKRHDYIGTSQPILSAAPVASPLPLETSFWGGSKQALATPVAAAQPISASKASRKRKAVEVIGKDSDDEDVPLSSIKRQRRMVKLRYDPAKVSPERVRQWGGNRLQELRTPKLANVGASVVGLGGTPTPNTSFTTPNTQADAVGSKPARHPLPSGPAGNHGPIGTADVPSTPITPGKAIKQYQSEQQQQQPSPETTQPDVSEFAGAASTLQAQTIDTTVRTTSPAIASASASAAAATSTQAPPPLVRKPTIKIKLKSLSSYSAGSPAAVAPQTPVPQTPGADHQGNPGGA